MSIDNTVLEILRDVFDDAPLHLEEYFKHEQEQPVLFKNKPVKTPRECLYLMHETEITSNILGYVALIFPELCTPEMTWERLRQLTLTSEQYNELRKAKTFSEAANTCSKLMS